MKTQVRVFLPLCAIATALGMVVASAYTRAVVACPQGCVETSRACMANTEMRSYNGIVVASDSLYDPGARVGWKASGSVLAQRFTLTCSVCECAAGCPYACLSVFSDCGPQYTDDGWGTYTKECIDE